MAAIITGCLALVAGAGPSTAAPPTGAYAAQATIVLGGHGGDRFVVRYTVTKGVLGSPSDVALLSQVFQCSVNSPSCPQVPIGSRVDPLPASTLAVGSSLGEAQLHTTWLGRPLAIRWRATSASGPLPTAGNTLVIDDGQNKMVYGQYALVNAAARVAVSPGHACAAQQPYVLGAKVGAATWAATAAQPIEPTTEQRAALTQAAAHCA